MRMRIDFHLNQRMNGTGTDIPRLNPSDECIEGNHLGGRIVHMFGLLTLIVHAIVPCFV